MKDNVPAFVKQITGHKPKDPLLFIRAFTHASRGTDHYERLEFLGDRVLGLVVADWIFDLFPNEPEGVLSRRFNVLVSRETCADVGRDLGIGAQAILGKQAREDGATDSDNVLGDIVEALIGALYLEGGIDLAGAFIRKAWGERPDKGGKAPKHPKSALQEWAAAHNKRPPVYELKGRTGAHHAPRFIVEVAIKGVGEAQAEGTSKQEAETAAAKALLEKVS